MTVVLLTCLGLGEDFYQPNPQPQPYPYLFILSSPLLEHF